MESQRQAKTKTEGREGWGRDLMSRVALPAAIGKKCVTFNNNK